MSQDDPLLHKYGQFISDIEIPLPNRLFIHSFIAEIYIAPLQVGLLRSAPNPSAAE